MIGFLLAIVLGGLLGYVGYFVSNNLIIAISIGGAFFVALYFFLTPWAQEYQRRHRLRHECYQFINSFVISMSVTESLDQAYQAATSGCEGEYAELVRSLERMAVRERLTFLEDYFESNLYSMFLSVYRLYEDRGGDILDLSTELLEEATRVEEAGEQEKKESRYSLVQYCLLWIISLGIVLFLRFGLSNFYDRLVQSWIFLASIGVYFLFLLGATLFYGFRYCSPTSISYFKKRRRKL